MLCEGRLVLPAASVHGLEQLSRIVSDAILEYDFDVFHISDVSGWITFHYDEVGVCSRRNGADAVFAPEIDRTVPGRNLDRLSRRESGRYQQLNLPMIPKGRNHAAELV